MTAPHEALPIVPDAGGPKLASMKLITATIRGFSARSTVEALGDWLVQSEWLSSVGQEYGVGKGSHTAKVVLDDPGTTRLSTTAEGQAAFVASEIDAQHLPRPIPGETGYIYLIYLTPDLAGSACFDFGGYHSELVYRGQQLSYAFVCDQTGNVENIELAATHEVIEAATDPFPLSAPGFQIQDGVWMLDGEVGDLCADSIAFVEGFAVQRTWSNRAAQSGENPCTPNAGEAYFNVSVTPGGIVSAAPGSTVTFHLRGWSTARVPDWSVVAEMRAGVQLSIRDDRRKMTAPLVAVPLPGMPTLNNGEEADLVLVVPVDATMGGSFVDIVSIGGSASTGVVDAVRPIVIAIP
jgi:hypothetical protein